MTQKPRIYFLILANLVLIIKILITSLKCEFPVRILATMKAPLESTKMAENVAESRKMHSKGIFRLRKAPIVRKPIYVPFSQRQAPLGCASGAQ